MTANPWLWIGFNIFVVRPLYFTLAGVLEEFNHLKTGLDRGVRLGRVARA